MRGTAPVALLLCGCVFLFLIAHVDGDSATTAAQGRPLPSSAAPSPAVNALTERGRPALDAVTPRPRAQESAVPVSPAAAGTSTDANTPKRETMDASEKAVTPEPSFTGRKQLQHIFSEPEIIAIVFGVMVGIVGTILLFAFLIKRLTRKSSVDMQSTFLPHTDEPLSSVATGLPE